MTPIDAMERRMSIDNHGDDHVHGPDCDHDHDHSHEDGHVHGPNCNHDHHHHHHHQQPFVAEVRPGRNDACWCGSGKKYKKCHLTLDRLPG
ncbi:MAG: SEC-C domain-containing protein [Myxococcales bacterium]|nr:SEC-C domain-containing protein [Myxococcales bacterium]